MTDEPAKRKNSTASVNSNDSQDSSDSKDLSESSDPSRLNKFYFCAGDHCETISAVTVRADEALESEVTNELPIGTALDIIDVWPSRPEIPLRAKIQAGSIRGWISVRTRLNEPLIAKRPQDLAEAISEFEVGGQHEVISLLTKHGGESLDSEVMKDLKPGERIVKIIKIGQTNTRSARVEADVAVGWISLTTRQGELLIRKIKIMLESARDGDLEAMKKIVEGKPGCMGTLPGRPNLNCSDNRDRTALIYAAAFGNKGIVNYLLNKRHEVDVNGVDVTQKTALHHAAKRNRNRHGNQRTQAGIVWSLLSAGAMTEARDHNGSTPLMFSVANGELGVTTVLLENGACVNAKDFEGSTCLDYALNFGYCELAALLKDCAAVCGDTENLFGDETTLRANSLYEQKRCQTNIIYEATISRLPSEKIQVCCTSMAGELLDTWYFGSDAALMKLIAQILNSKLVQTKCRTIGMKNPCVIFLLNDGTQVRPVSRIAVYECLTLWIQERFAVGETYAALTRYLAGEDSEDGGEDGEESEDGGEDGEESEDGGEDSEESEDRWQDDVCEAEFTTHIRSPSSGI